MLALPSAAEALHDDQPQSPPLETAPVKGKEPIVVLLIDDQPIVGRTVTDMLLGEQDIKLHLCDDPRLAMTLIGKLSPSVILLDLKMPHMDGWTLLERLRSDPATCGVPIIVLSCKKDPATKAQALGLQACDYLVKLPSRIELVARIRRHSLNYVQAKGKQQLTYEVTQAAKYIRSLLPPPMSNKHLRIDWRFVPSTQVGGDVFGFNALDDDHFAIYMLDVSGHGIGASLLAVTVLNTLSHQTLPTTDFHDPADVMRGLNKVFRMDKHGQRYFTIWYGIFSARRRTLTFSAGGHPAPALLNSAAPVKDRLVILPTCGVAIGITDDFTFQNQEIAVPQSARLLLYSDGVVEIQKPSGEFADQQSFFRFLSIIGPADDLLEYILQRARGLRQGTSLMDDCSLLQVDFV